MPTWSATFIEVLAFNVLLANGVAWFLWLFALHALSGGGAGIGPLAVPVVGVVAAWVHLGERPGAAEAVGVVLIIAALDILTLREVHAIRRWRRFISRPAGGVVEAPEPLG